ncbi:MAG: ABC transporter ATP-binding protein [Acidimicrobiia bacterium]
MLVARDLTWTAGGARIVEGVDLEVDEESLVGLIGPNGSGKTTVLRTIAGLLRPDRGRVVLDDVEVATLRRREVARRIALVEQHAETEVDLTVLDVVLLGRTPHRRALQGDSADDLALARAALAGVDLAGLAERPWHTLSGGERQRTQLARALTQQPRLLLLDEPTNHLDLGHQLQLLAMVRRSHVTTLAALHDLHLAAMFCDRLVVLHRGRVVAAGAVEEVLTPSLLADVFEVNADVTTHPTTGRPALVVHPPG